MYIHINCGVKWISETSQKFLKLPKYMKNSEGNDIPTVVRSKRMLNAARRAS